MKCGFATDISVYCILPKDSDEKISNNWYCQGTEYKVQSGVSYFLRLELIGADRSEGRLTH